MGKSMDIMVDDMTNVENTFGETSLLLEEGTVDSEGMSNNMILGIVIGSCVIIGIVLGIILGRRAARK